ncbi:MAG: hypothetical protein ACPGXL_03240 [Chitinophagales bacterium]
MKNFVHHLPILVGILCLLSLLTACQQEYKTTTATYTFEKVDMPPIEHSHFSNFYVGSDSTLLLSFLEKKDRVTRLRYTALATKEGASWTTPLTIAEGYDWFVNWADFPSISSLGDGTLLAHYLAKSGADTYAYDVNLTLNYKGIWSSPVVPHKDKTQTEHGFVSIFPMESNTAGVIWLDGRAFAKKEGKETKKEGKKGKKKTHKDKEENKKETVAKDTSATTEGHGHHEAHGHAGAMSLRFATIDNKRKVTQDIVIDSMVCECCQTDVVKTKNGAVVVYRNRSEKEIRDIYYSEWNKSTAEWSAGKPVHEDNWQIAGCPVNGPAVDALADTVVVAWFTHAQNKPQVFLAFSTDLTKGFSKPISIDEGKPFGRVEVKLLANGKALVSWLEAKEDDDKMVNLSTRLVQQNGTRSETVIVSEMSAERASGFPKMTNFNNATYITWTDVADTTSIKIAKAIF